MADEYRVLGSYAQSGKFTVQGELLVPPTTQVFSLGSAPVLARLCL